MLPRIRQLLLLSGHEIHALHPVAGVLDYLFFVHYLSLPTVVDSISYSFVPFLNVLENSTTAFFAL